ncbi:hypothetical protein [Aminipila terrae]|uniref:Uncharacterized protein n=1 Tax=Aminipila terrae TaxID=2697030 RepID=A0A6P1MAW7_9FIRM|nr:hypothetical protein [Aminipila terrae]QHI71829.1 hypothetical protein Ami3637_04990 [Aminipila terrae]
MQKNRFNNKQKIQIGTSSLLLIFTVLCLVVFSTLSLASARADYRLAAKNEKSVKAYYEADTKGEKLKKNINSRLMKLAEQAHSEEEFRQLVKQSFKGAFDEKNNSICYTVDAGNEQFLLIQLQLCDYKEVTKGRQNFRVTSWSIQNKVDYEVDNSMPVWDGN